MDFFINKNGTLPNLVMELIQDGRNDYDKFNELIQNANIYFSMSDIETGVRKISLAPASCSLKDACVDCPEEYYVIYKWQPRDTNKPGTYKGEFIFEFLDGSGTLIAPVRDNLYIHIRDGALKTC
jgi:hypothetical protein